MKKKKQKYENSSVSVKKKNVYNPCCNMFPIHPVEQEQSELRLFRQIQFILVNLGVLLTASCKPNPNNGLCFFFKQRLNLLDVFHHLYGGQTPAPPFSPLHPLSVQSLSVEQNEGLQLLGDVSPIAQAVLDDGSGSEALQRGVVDGLNDVPGQLLLVQEVAGGLLEGVGAVEVSPIGN